MLKKNLIFILLLLIPIAFALETSSDSYRTRIVIAPSQNISSTNYQQRIIVSQSATGHISSTNYNITVGFLFGTTTTTIPVTTTTTTIPVTTTTTTTTTIKGGTAVIPEEEACPLGYYWKDEKCIPKPVFLSVVEKIRKTYFMYFLLGGFLALIINYFIFIKKKEKKPSEKKDEKD